MPAFLKFEGVEGEFERTVEQHRSELDEEAAIILDALLELDEMGIIETDVIDFKFRDTDGSGPRNVTKLQLSYDIEDGRDVRIVRDQLDALLEAEGIDASFDVARTGNGLYSLTLTFKGEIVTDPAQSDSFALTEFADDLFV